MRTTIWWNPAVRFNSGGELEFEFWTADKATEYQIRGEGVDDEGNILGFIRKMTIEE